MPPEDIYQRQVRARPAEAMPLARAEDFGAGLAEQVGEVAGNQHRQALQNYQAERERTSNEEWAGFQRRLSEALTRTADFTRNGRKVDMPGHTARVQAWLDPELDRVFEGMTEVRNRDRGRAMVDDWKQRFLSGEADYEAAQGVNRTVSDFEKGRNDRFNRQRGLTDLQHYPGELQLGLDLIDAMDVGPDVKARLRAEEINGSGESVLQGLIDRDPESALSVMDAGLFNDMDPRRLEVLRNNAAVGIRSRQVQARSEAATQREAVGEHAALLIKQVVGDGRLVEDDALATLREQAVANGLPEAKIYEIDDAIARNKVNRIYRAANPPAIAGRIAEIDARLAGQPNQDPDLVLERNQLQRLLPARRNEVAANQLGWAARSGLDVAPFSLEPTAGAVHSWIVGAKSAAGSAGLEPRYLWPDGETQLRELANSGQAGALAALEFARKFETMEQAQAVARQIRPNDPEFEYLVTLANEARALALEGQGARVKNTKILDHDRNAHPEYASTFAHQDAQFNAATEGWDSDQREAIRATAMNILAGYAARGHPVDPTWRWRAYNQALGGAGIPGRGMRGGIAPWGDYQFVVPDGMTQTEFRDEVQRRWALADGPLNEDGTRADLRQAHPKRVGPRSYVMLDRTGSPFLRPNKRPFIVDIPE